MPVSRYAGGVDEDVARQIAALRGMLEEELDRRTVPQLDWWPLLVGALGALLGIALLTGLL